MGTSITIRNVPDDTHAELTSRAALAGQSLQEYLRAELIRMTAKPDLATWLARVDERLKKSNTSLSREQILEFKDADRA